jgi:hypothetical protein
MTAATRHRPGARTIAPRPRPATPTPPPLPTPPPTPTPAPAPATVVRRITIVASPPVAPAVTPATRRPTRGHSVTPGRTVATIAAVALIVPAWVAGLWFSTIPLGVTIATLIPWAAGAIPALGFLWLLGRTVARHCPGCRG